jgi:hypothetical protein
MRKEVLLPYFFNFIGKLYRTYKTARYKYKDQTGRGGWLSSIKGSEDENTAFSFLGVLPIISPLCALDFIM